MDLTSEEKEEISQATKETEGILKYSESELEEIYDTTKAVQQVLQKFTEPQLDEIHSATEDVKKELLRKRKEIEDEDYVPVIKYALHKEKEKINKKFNYMETSYSLKFIDEDFEGATLNSITASLFLSIEDALQQTCSNFSNDARVRVILRSSSLANPVSTRCTTKAEMSANLVLTTVMQTLQSCEEIPLNNSLQLDIVILEAIRGEGKRRKILNPEADGRLKRSIILIDNEDNLCMARGIVVGLAKLRNDPRYALIRKSQRPLQKTLAETLHSDAGVPRGSCGIEEAKQFEQYLDIQVNIVSLENGNKVVYKGVEKNEKIYLWARKIDNVYHYDVITKMSSFLGCNNYCSNCDKGFDKSWDHSCESHCAFCGRDNCVVKEGYYICEACNCKCRNETCISAHIKSRACTKFWFCDKCHRKFTHKQASPDSHVCGQISCAACNKIVSSNHLCYMQQAPLKPSSTQYIYFDFECDQENGEHIPNYCVAQYHNGEEVIFEGYDTQSKFCNWLFSEKHYGYTAIAHNMQGYDGIFLLNYLLSKGMCPETVMNGNKLLCIKIKSLKLRVIDSFSFIPMPLSNFPKTFGITELAKGYFPHFFNVKKNQNYVGPLPSASMYGVNFMKPSQRENFLKWHAEKMSQNYIFDFRREMSRYCQSDVDILRRCCTLFRDLFFQVAKCDPFRYLTIASVCMAVFRAHHIKENSIAMIPVQGYVSKIKFSKASIEWLDFLQSQKQGVIIEHGLNSPSGEKKIENLSVDGFCEKNNTVYEFYGCLFHGCDRCFDRELIHPMLQQKMIFLKDKTSERAKRIKDLGFHLVEIWECDWNRMKKDNIEVKNFLKTHKSFERLNPRDAFFGGRTNACQLFKQVGPGQSIKYIDFTSLYPWTNKYCQYPIGHPVIITKNFSDVSSYFGFIKCLVLPPRGLYHPVLPVRVNGKLFFPLCKTCAMEQFQSDCSHSDENRCLEGTWVSEELKLAITKGYKVIEIYEVYHFENSSNELFQGYVDSFLKLKQQASDWPVHCTTQAAKDKYINDYLENEGIELTKSEIKKNPGLRSVAKLCLNSFWGRFGMNERKDKVVYCRSNVEINKILANKYYELKSFHLINDNVMEISYCYVDVLQPQTDVTNIFIAAFTTAHARIKLYKALDMLGKDVLYFDTDSVVYCSDGTNDPPLGDYLGDFTDELDGDSIETFVSGGPKNYAYLCKSGKSTVKVRGFSLNFQNSQIINFDSVSRMVKAFNNSEDLKVLATVNNKFKRCKLSKTIKTVAEEKKYKIVYSKRRLLPNFDTVPYGY